MSDSANLRLFKDNMKRLIQRLYTIVITPLHVYGIVLLELLEQLHADLDKPGYTEPIPFRAFTFFAAHLQLSPGSCLISTLSLHFIHRLLMSTTYAWLIRL
jgi:hypothetical protein